MIIEETHTPGIIRIDCIDCGKMYPEQDFREEPFANLLQRSMEMYRYCPACEEKRRMETEKKALEDAKKKRYRELPAELINKCNLPANYILDRNTKRLFSTPPKKHVAEYIWENQERNMLISGITGSGKSTSVGYVATRLTLQNKKISYCTLQQLLTKWRDARRSDHAGADMMLLNQCFRNDVFIIDEVIGKSKISESGQELLFAILEAVNAGCCHAKIWLLGNFFTGSISQIFDDPEPVLRRLQENFTIARIDKKQIIPITVWEPEK